MINTPAAQVVDAEEKQYRIAPIPRPARRRVELLMSVVEAAEAVLAHQRALPRRRGTAALLMDHLYDCCAAFDADMVGNDDWYEPAGFTKEQIAKLREGKGRRVQ